jgi:lycopene cyclase-like protein
MEELRQSLFSRLRKDNILFDEVVGEEHCVIPMGAEIPTLLLRDNVLPFGAAAGLVHPATGYQLTRSLQLSNTIASALSSSAGLGSAAAVRAAYETMWPRENRISWEIYRQGASVLMGFDRKSMQRFVSSFFALESSQWLGFMEGTLSSRHVLDAMWRVFRLASPRLQLSLISGGSRAGCRSLGQVLSHPRRAKRSPIGDVQHES